MVKQLGGVIIEDLKDAHKCTHLVASDGKTSIKRTPKLMIALCVTTNIVTLKWLQDSAASGTLRDTKQYLILRDKEAEKAYSFSMSKTLQRVKGRQAKGMTLLQGRKVFVCQTVFKNMEDGKKSPPPTDLRLIVGAAGGQWVDKSKDLNAASAREFLVITNSDPKLKKSQEKQKDVASALASGAESVSLKSFLHAMMTQDTGSFA
jgi:Regulator of Ty1 transposition protein 107 BRCT domain